MKKITTLISLLLAIAVLLPTAATIAASAERPAISVAVDRLNAEISQINKDAQLPQGEAIIAEQLENDFNVSSDRISVLLGNMMQYGDAAAVRAFAEKLPEGITDRNVDEVTQSKFEGAWDQVAQNFGVAPGSIAGRLSCIEGGIQTALTESYGQGRAAGGGLR